MKKKVILMAMLSVFVLGFTACSGNEPAGFIGIFDAEEKEDPGYSVLTYTEVPNQNSLVSIQYPFFEGEGKEALNQFILEKVRKLAQIDESLFPAEAGLKADYQFEITLQNEKIISMVFWGDSSVSGGAYEIKNIIPLNIDLRTLEEVTFEDLYDAGAGFREIFFEKAYFPAGLSTTYDEDSFAEMLKLQSPEYQTVSPFSIPGNVQCFLKQDALVLSMPAFQASGIGHFEAQINYEDIQGFYLREQEYRD